MDSTFKNMNKKMEYIELESYINSLQNPSFFKDQKGNKLMNILNIQLYASQEKKLYIRSCFENIYSLLQQDIEKSQDIKFVLFSGTSGVGISSFRNFIIYKQIQECMEHQTSMILLLDCFPPNNETVMIFFHEGILFEIEYIDAEAIHQLKTSYFPIFYHIDVMDSDMKDISKSFVQQPNRFIYFIYSSLNERSWDEIPDLIDHSVLYFIPTWSIEELIELYLFVRGNGVIVNRLKNLHTEIPDIDPELDLTFSLGKNNVLFELGKTIYSFPFPLFVQVIEDESSKYGCIPKFLFQSRDFLYDLELATESAAESLHQNSFVLERMENVRERNLLFKVEPLELNGFIDYKKASFDWMSSLAIEKAISLSKFYDLDIGTLLMEMTESLGLEA